MAIKEVITELKQPIQQVSKPLPQTKAVDKKDYTNNSVLNDVLNETANGDEWKQMGGGTYDSSKMNEVLSSQYNEGDGTTQQRVNPNDPMSKFLNKDYRQVLQKVDAKAKQTRGV